jgi:hypothetical protein
MTATTTANHIFILPPLKKRSVNREPFEHFLPSSLPTQEAQRINLLQARQNANMVGTAAVDMETPLHW